jgi:site-specific recombinase XerD
LADLRQTYARLAGRTVKYQDHPSGRSTIDEPLSPATLRGYVRAWRAFFNWCVDENLLAISPARKLQLPKIPKQPPKAICRADIERILEIAKLSSARDYAIVCLLADSACRVGGLCAITLDNLDLDRRQAIVVSKGQTTFILFTDRTADAIRAYLRERPCVPSRALFIGERGLPLKPGGVHTLLDRLAEIAGVVGRHNPHSFRHGWAREALRKGADISDVGHVLGHSQLQTTFEFYGRWENGELHDIHDRFTLLNPVSPETPDLSAAQ